jgi:hypothetical protein
VQPVVMPKIFAMLETTIKLIVTTVSGFVLADWAETEKIYQFRLE